MTKKRLTYAEVEANLGNRLSFPPKVEADQLAPRDRSTWGGACIFPHSQKVEPRQRTKSHGEGESSTPKRPARLRKRRTFAHEHPQQVQQPPPVPTPISESFRRPPPPNDVTQPPQSSSSTQRPTFIALPPPNMERLRQPPPPSVVVTPDPRAEELQPPTISARDQYIPGSGFSSPVLIPSRPESPESVSTEIDAQEFLDLADETFPTPPDILHRRQKSQKSQRSQRQYPSVNNGGSYQFKKYHNYPKELTTHLVEKGFLSVGHKYATEPRKSLSKKAISDDDDDAKSIDTIHAIHRRPSTETLSGWVAYEPDTHSLRTIQDNTLAASPPIRRRNDPDPSDSAFAGSRCSTPTAVGVLTPPLSPNTLVADSFRFSAFSQLSSSHSGSQSPPQNSTSPFSTLAHRTKPGKSKLYDMMPPITPTRGTTGFDSFNVKNAPVNFNDHEDDQPSSNKFNPNYRSDPLIPKSSRSSVFNFDDLCLGLEYDYCLAVDVLIYGAELDYIDFDNLPEIESMYTGTPAPTRDPSTIAKFMKHSRQPSKSSMVSKGSWVAISMPGSAHPSVFFDYKQQHRAIERREAAQNQSQRRSIFSQVSHLFIRAS